MAAGQYGTPCAEFGHNHRPIHISVGILSPQQSSLSAARALAWTWIARALAQPRIARALVWTRIARTRRIGRASWAGHRRRGCFAACLACPGHLFRHRGEPHREDDEGANHANEDREDQGQETCI